MVALCVVDHNIVEQSHNPTTGQMSPSLPKLSCVSLFAGGGGLDLGLEAAGFRSLFATDIDEHSCITLRRGAEEARTRGSSFLSRALIDKADIVNLTGNAILARISGRPGELDLLAGGPPCQAFSVFGKRMGRLDPRGKLAFEYLRVVSELQPKAFVFENVYGILTSENGEIFRELCERLADPKKGLRYRLSIHRVNAVDYGVPQFRDRVFIIGSRDGLEVRKPAATTVNPQELWASSLPPWRTVDDAFRALPLIDADYPANHTGRVHSDRIIKRYRSLRAGERDPHTRINKLDLKRPSFTIIVGSDKGGGKGHVHPTEPREVTPRESARIQTFPDWWAFSGTSRHPIRQIGNAVPPLLAGAIGGAIAHDLFAEELPSFEHLLEQLDQSHLFEAAYV